MSKLKTRYRHIHFRKGAFPNDWTCVNNRSQDTLGHIEHYPPWGCYVASFSEGVVFDQNCLRDIAHFLEQLSGGKEMRNE